MTSKKTSKLWILWAIIGILVLSIVAFYFSPLTLPENQGQKLRDEAAPYDVVIIYNPGGLGNATLAESVDFTPVLNGMQQTLKDLGYSSTAIAYTRTPAGLAGGISDIKEMFNSFKYSSQIQAEDLKYLMDSYPGKKFILVGFSNGGGLTGKTMESLTGQPNVVGLAAGVPCLFQIQSSSNFLVLNNSGRDSLSACDWKSVALALLEGPFKWIWAKITGRDLSFSLAFEFPDHAYPWSSPEVGPPVTDFLKTHFKAKTTLRPDQSTLAPHSSMLQ